MRPLAALVLLFTLLVHASAQEEVYRRANTPMGTVSLTATQRKRIKAVDQRFKPRMMALRRLQVAGHDIDDRRDALNHEYSKALLDVMTPPQKTAYLEAVYRHMQDFLATHKDKTMDQVFIWGGAYAKQPANP